MADIITIEDEDPEVVEVPANPLPPLTTKISLVERNRKRSRTRRNPVPIFRDPSADVPVGDDNPPNDDDSSTEDDFFSDDSNDLEYRGGKRATTTATRSQITLRSGTVGQVRHIKRHSSRLNKVPASEESNSPVEQQKQHVSPAKPKEPKKHHLKVLDYSVKDGQFCYKVAEDGETKTLTGEAVRRKCLVAAVQHLESRIRIKDALPFRKILQMGEYLKKL